MMRIAIISWIAVVLIAGQVFSPVSADSGVYTCGSSHKVQNMETLSSIAVMCDTTVANLLALNPQVANPNLIYVGQDLMIRGRAPVVKFVVYHTTAKTTYIVQEGDTWLKIATLYGTTIWDITQANPGITFFTKLTPGMELKIPAGTRAVKYSYASGIPSYFPNAKVSLSAGSTKMGDDITASVSGFPGGAYIDYRIGRTASDYVYVYDGITNEEGQSSVTFEVPSKDTEVGGWVVFVTTTGQKEIVVTASASFSVAE